MKQTIAMKQAAFEELMREHGFQYLGATTYDGNFIYQRTWHRMAEVAFYGPMESTYKIMAYISYGVPIIQLFEDGRALGTRDYFQPQAGNQRHPGNPPVRRIRVVRRGDHE